MAFTTDKFAKHMLPITGSAIREIFHLLGKPGIISFAGGNPSNAALEPDVIAGLARDVLSEHGTKILQYGATEGFAPLKETVAEFVKGAGVTAAPDEVLPVQGSQQALDLLLKALIDPGDIVLVENPTFLGALQAMRTYQAKPVAIPTDDKGVIVEAAEEAIKAHNPKLIYVIPTFQNPTGVTLSLERRKALARLAARYGVMLAEDDPYRDLRYGGTPLPSVKSFDEEGWVAYMGSFSKLIAPGLRVGAVITNKTLMRKLIIGKQSADVHSPTLNQAIVDAYLRRGLMGPHVKKINAGYGAQLNAMLEGFKYFPEGTAHTNPEGGLFVWAALPEGADALNMLNTAVSNNVAYVPGIHFYAENGTKNTMRLNFSNSDVPAIECGMRILGDVAKSFT